MISSRMSSSTSAHVIDGRLAGIDEQPAAPLMLFGSL
jgi:hypothetical protein